MDEANEITTAPPSTTDIMTAINEMRTDINNLRTAMHEDVTVRLERVEQTIAELPTTYASTDSVSKVKTSQTGYESSLRQLTGQVADLVNMQADSKTQFTTIESRLNELSTMKSLLTTFMQTQRERLEYQQSTITEVKKTTETLTTDVALNKEQLADTEKRFIEDYVPLRDFIKGSATQKPLITIIDGIKSTLTTHGQTLQPVTDYVMALKAKEVARVNFRQRVWLQLFTKTGFALMIFSVLLVIILVQSIDLERSFNWIRQLAAAFGFKAG